MKKIIQITFEDSFSGLNGKCLGQVMKTLQRIEDLGDFKNCAKQKLFA